MCTPYTQPYFLYYELEKVMGVRGGGQLRPMYLLHNMWNLIIKVEEYYEITEKKTKCRLHRNIPNQK